MLLRLIMLAALAAPLQPKQSEFAGLVAELIQKAQCMGYQVTLGEAWRSEDQAKFEAKKNAEKGIGISNSLHTLRLAVDLNLFKGGKFLSKTSDYEPLGKWWESRCPLCRWGGRFSREDGNHFSMEHNGVK